MKYILSVLLIYPVSAMAFFGTLGRDQCPHPTTPMPTYQGDYNHSYLMQAQQLEEMRRRLTTELSRLNGEQARLQAAVRGYFQAPWYDTILAHMDNGLDCCEGGRMVADSSDGGARTIASAVEDSSATETLSLSDLSGGTPVSPGATPTTAPPINEAPVNTAPTVTDSEVTGGMPVSPGAADDCPPSREGCPNYRPPNLADTSVPTPTPLPQPAPVIQPAPVTQTSQNLSCNGYPPEFCNNTWGAPASPPQPGAQCLQTGFAATPAWYRGACRSGGRIDPQACSHPRISRNPNEYQACLNALVQYYRFAGEKRRLAAQLQELNNRIHALRNPNRAYRFANENVSPGFNIGNLLGTLAPLMMQQYSSYRQPAYQYRPGTYRTMPTPVGGAGPRPFNSVAPYGPQPVQPAYATLPQPPPPFYGPRYGYGFSYAGNYGGLPPGYRTGSFGCSTGVGSGFNLLSMLMGRSNYSQVGPRFGPNAGYGPYQAYNLAYGNRYAGIPPQTFPGYTQPYRPGGIYGGPVARPPVVTPNNGIPQFYTNQPRPVGAPYSFQPSIQPQPIARTQPRYVGAPNNPQYDAYFYAQNQNLQQNYWQYRRSYEMNNSYFETQMYQPVVYQRPYQPGLVPTLLSMFNNN